MTRERIANESITKAVSDYRLAAKASRGSGTRGKEKEDSPPILNALAWYAGEEVARAYCDAFDPQ